MAIVVIIVFALFVAGGIAYLQYRTRQARIAAVAATGKRIGFSFTQDDVEGVINLPFRLFSMGDGRRVELVLTGEHNGLPLRLFDYWYYDETTDSHGNRTKSYHRFTCGVLTFPASCPHLRLGHEGFFSRLGSHMGMHDVQFESDEFNKQFRVKCDDQKFAFCLVDGQMMEWLASADDFESVEINGSFVLLAASKLDPAQWPNLGTWLDTFHNHIPPVLYAEYPPAPAR